MAISSGTIAIADPNTNASTASAAIAPIAVSISTLGPLPPPPPELWICSNPVTATEAPAGAAADSAGSIRSITPVPSGVSGLGMSISAQVVRPSLEISFGLWVLA